MTLATHGTFLIALNPDVEYHYMTFLRIAEVFKLGAVCRTLRERVRTSTQSYPWDVVHKPLVDPAPLTWLTGIAKIGGNIRSVQLVRLELRSCAKVEKAFQTMRNSLKTV